MRRLLSLVAKLVRRSSADDVPPLLDMPPAIQQCLAQRDNGTLQRGMQSVGRTGMTAQMIATIKVQTAAAGWDPSEIEKMLIFACYHCADMKAVLERTAAYVNRVGPDEDLDILWAYARYHLGEFEAAYEALLRLRPRENVLLRRSDYAVVGMLICQAAG